MKGNSGRGYAAVFLVVGLAIVAILLVAILPMLSSLLGGLELDECLDVLLASGYIAYADDQGILHVEGVSISGSPPIELTGDAKVWLEFRPELDFDVVKKNTVPVSYQRGVFTSFELPIWASDDQELFFEICIPNRWDGTSMSHIHLDVFLPSAQDDGDAFKLQVDYQHLTTGGDVVPATFTTVVVETATGASAAFLSLHVHFDIPASDMEADDILAFRVRRIAVTEGVEISGNVVVEHAGVVFRCDKIGIPTYE